MLRLERSLKSYIHKQRSLTRFSSVVRRPMGKFAIEMLKKSPHLLENTPDRNIAHFSFSMLGVTLSSPFIISTVLLSLQGNTAEQYQYINTSSGFRARYNGPPVEDMNEAQLEIRSKILESRKGTGLSGPFGPWLAIPEVAEPAQELGRACRYGTSLSFRESELVILLTGAKTRSHAEFDIHVGEALKAGIDMEVIQAIPRDENFSLASVESKLVPLLDNDREKAMARFVAELLDTYTVSDDTYAATKASLDDKDTALVEIVSIVGYYNYVAFTLNAFRIPSKAPDASTLSKPSADEK